MPHVRTIHLLIKPTDSDLMKQGSALVIVSCAKSSVILVRFLFSSHVVDFSSCLLPVHPWNDHFSTYSVLVLKVPVILVSVIFRSHQCLLYCQMSHLTTVMDVSRSNGGLSISVISKPLS